MQGLTRPRRLPASLDVGKDEVRLLQLARTPGGLRVLAAARRSLPSPADGYDPLIRALRAIQLETPFISRDVVATIPSNLVHFRTFRVAPPADGQRVSEIRAHAGTLFPFDLEQADFRIVYAGPVRQGGQERVEIVAAACRHDDIAAFLAALRSAGLRAVSLRLGPEAAYRAAAETAKRAAGTATREVIDIRARETIVVIGNDEQIHFIKTLPIGLSDLSAAVAEKLGIGQEEAEALFQRILARTDIARDEVAAAVLDARRGPVYQLAGEVATCFRYHAATFPGQMPGHIAVTGADAADVDLLNALRSALPIEPEIADPLRGLDCTALSPCDRPASAGMWSMAMGMLDGWLDERKPAGRSSREAPDGPLSCESAHGLELLPTWYARQEQRWSERLGARVKLSAVCSAMDGLARAAVLRPGKSAIATAALGTIVGCMVRQALLKHAGPSSAQAAAMRTNLAAPPAHTGAALQPMRADSNNLREPFAITFSASPSARAMANESMGETTKSRASGDFVRDLGKSTAPPSDQQDWNRSLDLSRASRKPAVSGSERQLRLQSILMGPQPRALLNGTMVKEGDVVASYRVLRIEARRIIVEREGIQLTVPIE